MLRKTLLATTALVLGASVAFAMHTNVPNSKIQPKQNFGTPGHVVHGMSVNFSIGNTKHQAAIHNNKLVPGGGLYNNFSKDPNAEFVSWYGFRAENSAFSSYYSSHDFIRDNEIASNAVGFTTSGGKLKSMTFAGFAYSASDEFKGAILSSVGGLPGASVATTSSTTMSDNSLCCTSARTVKFKKTTLPSGSYFATVECANAPCDGGWAMEDTDFSGATVDYFHAIENETYNFGSGTYSYHSSSPWHASTYYPTAGAVIVK